MRKLVLSLYLLALGLLMFGANALRADVFVINSANFNDGHYFIGGYNSQVNGFGITSYCVEFNSHVGFGEPFQVTSISLADYQGADKNEFEQAAFLTLQMVGVTDIDTLSAIQRALWLITSPGNTDPYLNSGGTSSWMTLAASQTYNSSFDSQFVLYLRDGVTGQSQIAGIPEPSAWQLIGCGAIAFVGYRRFLS